MTEEAMTKIKEPKTCRQGLVLAYPNPTSDSFIDPSLRLVGCCLGAKHDGPCRAKLSRTFFFEWSYVRRKAHKVKR